MSNRWSLSITGTCLLNYKFDLLIFWKCIKLKCLCKRTQLLTSIKNNKFLLSTKQDSQSNISTKQWEIGGWPDKRIIEKYLTYADLCFRLFGDRVKTWVTFHEPWEIARLGYGDAIMSPNIKKSGDLDYKAGHNIIKSHAMAYRWIKNCIKWKNI